MTMGTTIEQGRSRFALEQVRSLATPAVKDFAKLASGLPAMILQNGLGQTLAFLLAKGTKDGKVADHDKHILAFNMVVGWLAKQQLLQKTGHARTMEELSQMEQRDYLGAQREALKILEWVKRYANADLSS
jgi:CRISPR-associated protein Cmr5